MREGRSHDHRLCPPRLRDGTWHRCGLVVLERECWVDGDGYRYDGSRFGVGSRSPEVTKGEVTSL